MKSQQNLKEKLWWPLLVIRLRILVCAALTFQPGDCVLGAVVSCILQNMW